MIPIKCFSCGMPLADRYMAYVNEVMKRRAYTMHRSDADVMTPEYLSTDTKPELMKPSIHGEVLNDLGITNLCCRGCCLTHVYSAGDYVPPPPLSTTTSATTTLAATASTSMNMVYER